MAADLLRLERKRRGRRRNRQSGLPVLLFPYRILTLLVTALAWVKVSVTPSHNARNDGRNVDDARAAGETQDNSKEEEKKEEEEEEEASAVGNML